MVHARSRNRCWEQLGGSSSRQWELIEKRGDRHNGGEKVNKVLKVPRSGGNGTGAQRGWWRDQ